MKIKVSPFIILVIPFIMFFSTQGSSWYSDKETFRGYVYQDLSVPAIDVIQSMHSQVSSIVTFAMSYADKSIFEKKMVAIESALKEIENELRLQEQKAIDIILRKNGLDESTRDFCFQVIKDLKKFGKQYMDKPRENIYHDKTIPTQLYTMLITCLKRDNIDPDSINIINKIEDEELQKEVFEDAITMAPYHNWSVRDNELIIHKEQPHFYGFITLLPKIKKISSIDEQEAILTHECEHIKEQHSTTCGVIKSCLYRLTDNYNEDKLLNSPEWHDLIHIHEQEAEIFPSLREPRTASIMRKMRASHHYTGMLYETHYNTLSHIDENWKQYTWLKKKTQ
jgi:hypothetical protein